MKTIGVLTSGGDSPAMNAAIRAVVRIGTDSGLRVLGIQNGYNGLIHGDVIEMNRSSVADIIHRGGTMLKTARSDEFKTPEGREKAINVMEVLKIDGLIVIGGDGSFKGAQLLAEKGIPTIGIPGTIDNDLPYTEYTIGFDTALNTVLDAINKIRDTSTSHQRVSVIEVMGRECGDLALHAGIAGGAESVILPEKEFDFDEICQSIFEGKRRGKLHNLIILAEGVAKKIGGAHKLVEKIEAITGIESRATVLGYIQRGGNPSAYDRVLASKLGAKAVELLIEGKGGRVVGIRKGQVIDMDINEALKMERTFDEKLYNISKALSY
ncbi:MAG: 6-phosphofructokinase [Clostridium argentinense]|uniref:ATP-dependent 6-phosphofructokinase n=1 Tax=Clostridium faecium TaxID=2762223 RepID=A0ABR8YXV1_9CLOT|nr:MULTISPECIES: 6-phosphofructokinase [Clostridium]MBD8048746.1 6-phosphofructokinase [Clostridium faecium]MBS5822454.1 6-phosphofructokinase [Clostridium argentinense]MDU1350139.1 6-phosphofructokinase [Clostridium argentinense]